MSEEKREAHNLYMQYLTVSADNVGTSDPEVLEHLEESRGRVTMMVLQFLCQCRPQERFRHIEFPNLIISSSKVEGFEVEKAVQAFQNLEQYLLLLCLMPWKQEYHKIKKYGGFYQSKIEAHLKNADSIFRLVGFTERVAGLLILTHATKADIIQYIAFECLCAAVECRIINDIWQRTRRRKIHILEVVNIRMNTAGSAEIIVSFIESKYGVAKQIIVTNVIDGDTLPQEGNKMIFDKKSPTTDFRNKLQDYMKISEKLDAHSDIPFMDDDNNTKELNLTPGNFDDHLMASLQIVGGKEASPVSNDQNSGIRASQEWSFVREGLENTYGKKYFEGVRKDILSSEKEDDFMSKSQLQKNVKDIPIQTTSKLYPKLTPEMPVTSFGAKTLPPTFSNDSAYASAIPSPIYPPKCSESSYVQNMLVPAKHDSEVVKRGVSGMHTVPCKGSKTEPIARRPADRDPTQGYYTTSIKDSSNTDNIKKYQKNRSSVPVRPKEVVGQETLNNSQHSSMSNSGERKSMPGYGQCDSVGGRVSGNVRDGSSVNIIVNGTSNSLNKNVNIQRSSSTWQCMYCTYMNTSSAVICAMCSKTKEVPDMDSPSAGMQLRVCEQCTLENSNDATECSACGHQLKNTQTVV